MQNTICVVINNDFDKDTVINSVAILINTYGNFGHIYVLSHDKEFRNVPLISLKIIDIKQTGDDYKFKICDRCFVLKYTSEEFENNRIKKGGKITKRPSCRDCRRIKDGVNIPASIKSSWMKKKPRIGEIFTCPICKKKSLGGVSKHVLDHNHHNGVVRGFLCESCNTGIGRFDDNPELVRNAIDWLKRKPDL